MIACAPKNSYFFSISVSLSLWTSYIVDTHKKKGTEKARLDLKKTNKKPFLGICFEPTKKIIALAGGGKVDLIIPSTLEWFKDSL